MVKKLRLKQIGHSIKSIDLNSCSYVLVTLLILSSAVIYITQFNFQSNNDAKKIMDGLSSEDTDFVIENDALDSDKLNSINFDELKKELNIKSDVAIYFEDSKNDELIPIKGSSCFGSKNIELNGMPCKSRN